MKRILNLTTGAFIGTWLSFPPIVAAFTATSDVPDAFDILENTSAKLPTAMAKQRNNALLALQSDLHGIQLKHEFQPNGAIGFVRNTDIGKPLLPGFALPEQRSAEKAARLFIEQYRGLFGLETAALSSLVVDKNGIIGATDYAYGVYYISFIQKIDGIRAHGTRITFAIHVDTGDLYSITSNLFGMPESRAFPLTYRKAVEKILATAGIKASPADFRNQQDWKVADVKHSMLEGPVRIKKVYVHAKAGYLVPAYVAEVWTADQGLLEIAIDAKRGSLLRSLPRTNHASYQMSGWVDYPVQEDGLLASPEVISVTPDTIASPSGWLYAKGSDGYYRTVGPNVEVFYDWEGEYAGYEYEESMRQYSAPHTAISSEGTSSQVVKFDYVSQWANRADPHEHVQLSMAEIFRVLNERHDHYYHLGFTPDEGNFQDDDPVLVNAQDGYNTGSANNANMSTPADGTSGRMNMYIFNDSAGAARDGTMDRSVFSHELGHGLSWRLVNFGDASLVGNQSGAFGEGQADVSAFMREDFWATEPDLWALATYVGWEYFDYVVRGPAILTVTEEFATDIRRPLGRFTAYTYDVGDEFNIQDTSAQRTLEHYGFLPLIWIRNGAIGNRYVGFYGDYTYYATPESHSDGEIWAVANWRTKVRVRDQDWSNSSTDDRLLGLEQTYLMGMQLMPANPSFIQARDALIIYEEMTQSEPASCIMKYEFARTGMGKNAYSGTNGSYGSESDYDEVSASYPEIITDFSPWGCAPNTYNTNSGEVTMLFTVSGSEIEINQPAELHLLATTPGYNTSATITGPFVGTVALTSLTDTMDEIVGFTPTANGTATFSSTVSSTRESKSQTVSSKVVTVEVLEAAGDQVADAVPLGENDHFKLFIDGSLYTTGTTVTMALRSTDGVDIDLYFNLDTLALPEDNLGYDADSDGNETLTLSRTDVGWETTSGVGTVYELEPTGEDFYFYLDVAGFTESAYSLTVTRTST